MPITIDANIEEEDELIKDKEVAPNLVPQTSLLQPALQKTEGSLMEPSVPQEEPVVPVEETLENPIEEPRSPQEQSVEEPVVPQETVEEPVVPQETLEEPKTQEDTYVASENQAAFNSLFGISDTESSASIYSSPKYEPDWQDKMEDEKFLKSLYDGTFMTDGTDRSDARFIAHKVPAGIAGIADIATFLLPTVLHNAVDFGVETGEAPFELVWNMVANDMSFDEAAEISSPQAGFTPQWFGISLEELYMQEVAQVEPESAIASYAGNSLSALVGAISVGSALRKIGKSTDVLNSDLPDFLKTTIRQVTENPKYYMSAEGLSAIGGSLSSEAALNWYLSDEAKDPAYAPVVAVMAGFLGGTVGYKGIDWSRPAYNQTAMGLKFVSTTTRTGWNAGRRFFNKLEDNEQTSQTISTLKKTHVGAVIRGIDKFINKGKSPEVLDVDVKLSDAMSQRTSTAGLFADEIFDKLQKEGMNLSDFLGDSSRLAWLEANSPLDFGENIAWINYAKTPHQQKFALMLAEIQGDTHVEKTFARVTQVDEMIRSKVKNASPLEKRALILAAQENYKIKVQALEELYMGVDELTNLSILSSLDAPESRTVVGAIIKDKFAYFREHIKKVNDSLYDVDPTDEVIYPMNLKVGSSAELQKYFKFEVPDSLAKEVTSSLNVAQARSILELHKDSGILVKVGKKKVDITEIAESISKQDGKYSIGDIPKKYREVTYTNLDTVIKELKTEKRTLDASGNDADRARYLSKSIDGLEEFLNEGLAEFPDMLKQRETASTFYKQAYLPVFGKMSVGGDSLAVSAKNTTVGKVAADSVGAMIWGGPGADTNLRRLALLANEQTPDTTLFTELQGLGTILTPDMLEKIPGVDSVYRNSKAAHDDLMSGVASHVKQEIARVVATSADPKQALKEWRSANFSKLGFFPEQLKQVDDLIKDPSTIYSSPAIKKAMVEVRLAEQDQTTKLMKQLMDTDDLDTAFSRILKSDISSLSMKEWLATFKPEHVPVVKRQAVSSIFQKAFNSENPDALLDTVELLKAFQGHKKGLKVLLGEEDYKNMQMFMEQVEVSNNTPTMKVVTDFDALHPSSKMATLIREMPSLFTSLRQREIMGINRTYLALLHAGKIAAKRAASMSDSQVEELTYFMSKLLTDREFASKAFEARSKFSKSFSKADEDAAAFNINRTWLSAGLTLGVSVNGEDPDPEWVADVNAIDQALTEGRSRGIDDQQIIDRITRKLAKEGLENPKDPIEIKDETKPVAPPEPEVETKVTGEAQSLPKFAEVFPMDTSLPKTQEEPTIEPVDEPMADPTAPPVPSLESTKVPEVPVETKVPEQVTQEKKAKLTAILSKPMSEKDIKAGKSPDLDKIAKGLMDAGFTYEEIRTLGSDILNEAPVSYLQNPVDAPYTSDKDIPAAKGEGVPKSIQMLLAAFEKLELDTEGS